MTAGASTTVEIPLPYNLTWDEVQIEPTAYGSSMDSEMSWLDNMVSWDDEAEIERIFRSVVILHHKFPNRTLSECLSTAITWERG